MSTISYNEINKSVGKSKAAKIFGVLFLLIGLLFSLLLFSTMMWKLTEEPNRNMEYVYNDNGMLYYENNGKRIYVDKTFNTINESIEVDIPNEMTVTMFCDKNNSNECVYIDLSNTLDSSILNPFFLFLINIFSYSMAIFLLKKKRFKKNKEGKEGTSLDSIYLFGVFLFGLGILTVGMQLNDAVTYFKLKQQENNIVKAVIYSEIYNDDKKNDYYKPVAYYYVDNIRYLYVPNTYLKGNLKDSLGTTIELYYDINDPSMAVSKNNPINKELLVLGLFLSVISIPLVFFKGKQEARIDRETAAYKAKEWKI